WGLLAMLPLSFTVAVIYGAAGLISGNLDTPLAVLTAVSIGLAVDYAIHFIVRSRELQGNTNTWEETIPAAFGEPARAITRNVIVVGVGFLPLLLTPLVPYQMVGILLSSILTLAGVATLVILPAFIYMLEKKLFNMPSQGGGQYET
ncbi:MAG: MMPL family transporter, partial [Gammaproteobacteria bacterium]|nr:MMPL family transporter [Gammaproteobacteria bacterium]